MPAQHPRMNAHPQPVPAPPGAAQGQRCGTNPLNVLSHSFSTLLGSCEGGGEPGRGDGLAAQGAGAEDEGQDDLQFTQDLVKAHPGAGTDT